MARGSKGGFGAGSKAVGGPGKRPVPPPSPMMPGPGAGAPGGTAFKKGGSVKKADNAREERAEKKADKKRGR